MMDTEPLPKTYTSLDHFLINKLTKEIPKSITNNRKTFQCNIDMSLKCPFIMQSKGINEYQRFFNHLLKEHQTLIANSIIKFLFANQSITKNWSSIININEYIEKNILAMYESKKNKIDSSNISVTIQKNSEHCLDISNIDFTKLNQTVLEHGIFEHLPLKTIYSKDHFLFIIGFLKLGFEIGRNTNISVQNFLEICKGVKVSRNLLEKVGDDYFLSNIAPFKGGYASFQIDASKINDKEILVFILTSKSRLQGTFLFDIEQNFDGNLITYRNVVREKILKAKENQITIVGLTSDNLPTQISALSQDSIDSLQNKFSDMQNIIHFRCCLHLLNLAYKDWIKTKNILTTYENKIKNILKILNKNIFAKKISRKIPKICITRWNSAFKALESILYLRKEIMQLIQNANEKEMKILLLIKNDIKFIFSIGILKVYPLLFHFASLMDYMQSDNISCVEAIIIIEYFLRKIKNNIQKYKIEECGYDLYKFIKKRLILNKNIQLYNLASLFHPDGIVRYRNIMGKIYSNFNVTEEDNDYFHCIKDKISIEIAEKNRYISIEEYKKNEYKKVLNDLSKAFTIKNLQRKKTKNSINTNQIQLDMHHYFSVELKSTDESTDEDESLPNTIDLNPSNKDEIENEEEEDLQDEIVKEKNIIYNLNKKNKTACIIDNENATGDILIPRSITHIAKDFIIIGINSRSFENSEIKSIKFPINSEILSIQKDSFVNSTIEDILIPSSLQYLEDGWCRGTPKLTNIIISPKNEKFAYLNDTIIIGKSVDDNYDTIHFVRRNAKNVVIPTCIIKIASYAFSDSSIDNIVIPQTIATIGEGAFYNCKYLQNINIPLDSKLTSFEKFTFIKTALESITIPSTISELCDFWCEERTKINIIQIDKSEETNLNKTKEDIIEFEYSNDEDIMEEINDDNENEQKQEGQKEIEYSSDEDYDDKNNEIVDCDKITLDKIIVNYANDKYDDNQNNSEDKANQTNQDGNDSEDSNNNESICYENRKSALEWANIGDLFRKYARNLSLTEEKANQATVEIYDLITLHFSVFKSKIPSAISKTSKYSHFWSTLRGFKHNDKTFSTLADISSRLYAISSSEVDAERAFSKLKWRFNDKRNCVKQKTMIQELHIEHEQKKKIKSESEFSESMWQHPNHNE